MKALIAITCCLFATLAYSQRNDDAAIRHVLATQAAQWNKGDIAGYMAAGYWQNDSLLFIGKGGPSYGYATTLAHYQKAYPDAAHTGTLHFELINVRLLSASYAFVTGKWSLNRSAGDVSGYFTLLFRKLSKGSWVIIEDHSS